MKAGVEAVEYRRFKATIDNNFYGKLYLLSIDSCLWSIWRVAIEPILGTYRSNSTWTQLQSVKDKKAQLHSMNSRFWNDCMEKFLDIKNRMPSQGFSFRAGCSSLARFVGNWPQTSTYSPRTSTSPLLPWNYLSVFISRFNCTRSLYGLHQSLNFLSLSLSLLLIYTPPFTSSINSHLESNTPRKCNPSPSSWPQHQLWSQQEAPSASRSATRRQMGHANSRSITKWIQYTE